MRDEDKPFVMYRRGRWNFNIVPRGRKGWVQFGIWMALLAPPTIAFVRYTEAYRSGPEFVTALVLFLAFTLVWCLGGIWWMKARAEVVDVEAVLKLKREAERQQRGGH